MRSTNSWPIRPSKSIESRARHTFCMHQSEKFTSPVNIHIEHLRRTAFQLITNQYLFQILQQFKKTPSKTHQVQRFCRQQSKVLRNQNQVLNLLTECMITVNQKWQLTLINTPQSLQLKRAPPNSCKSIWKCLTTTLLAITAAVSTLTTRVLKWLNQNWLHNRYLIWWRISVQMDQMKPFLRIDLNRVSLPIIRKTLLAKHSLKKVVFLSRKRSSTNLRNQLSSRTRMLIRSYHNHQLLKEVNLTKLSIRKNSKRGHNLNWQLITK